MSVAQCELARHPAETQSRVSANDDNPAEAMEADSQKTVSAQSADSAEVECEDNFDVQYF